MNPSTQANLPSVDLTELRCPLAFVKAKRAVLNKSPGSLLLLISDPGTRRDVPRWLQKNQIKYSVLVDNNEQMQLKIIG